MITGLHRAIHKVCDLVKKSIGILFFVSRNKILYDRACGKPLGPRWLPAQVDILSCHYG